MPTRRIMDVKDTGELRKNVDHLEETLMRNHRIDPDLYEKYDVKRGLRDKNGKGVLTGLTEVSDVCSYNTIDGKHVPIDGELYYQGINVIDLINGLDGRKFGFEETCYLLLFGKLPSDAELKRFLDVFFEMQTLTGHFVRDVIMKASNPNIMNAMERCILTLYSYDSCPDAITPKNVFRQSLELISKLPLIAVYSYHSYRHFRMNDTLLIRNPKKGLSLAENILLMLRPDGKYT